jgi:hypothetical protein
VPDIGLFVVRDNAERHAHFGLPFARACLWAAFVTYVPKNASEKYSETAWRQATTGLHRILFCHCFADPRWAVPT